MRKLHRGAVESCFWICAVALVTSCGQQANPSLQLETKPPVGERGATNPVPEAADGLRSSSELDDVTQNPGGVRQRLEVFQGKIEPLALQKGGSARVVLPVSDDPSITEQIQSITFSSVSTALRSSAVQGRVLTVVVENDASEGRHDARIRVQLGNGAIFSQPLAISVLP